MHTNNLDKLKIKYNYNLARLYNGYIYITSTKFLESAANQQNKILNVLEEVNRTLLEIQNRYEMKSGIKMSSTEIKSGFKD